MKSNAVRMAAAIVLFAQTAQAQGDLLGTDDMAEAIVAMTTPVWTGPRTPAPPEERRPTGASTTIRSDHALVAVHADMGANPETLRRVTEALEYARLRLDAMGWPAPIPDGDLGGGPELDLYLRATPLSAGAHADGLVPWTYLDRASVFAVLDPATPAEAIEACVTDVYAEAMLLSLDPAEARAWRRATAAWLTWELTGHFGCEDELAAHQKEPFRSWIAGAAGDGAGGALLLAYLSARHDKGTGQFIRETWELATQRTWEGVGLRAEPDLWSALETSVERSGDRLLDNVEELAVLRWFVGRADAQNGLIASIDQDAQARVARRLGSLPIRVSTDPPLQPFGTAFMVLDASAWKGAKQLRAWVRGEYGVRWSFVAVQLDERNAERRRIVAPHTGATPRAYLPIELDGATRRVLFVVTNLSSRLPDADEPNANERSFELIVTRGSN